jgi:hypothetical protein
VYNYYYYYLRADTREEIESRLVGAGLGTFSQINGVTAFVEGDGVVVDHLGQIIGSAPLPDAETLKSTGEYFIPTPIIKDSRWHTNLRTKMQLCEAQKVYLPLIPPPSRPKKQLAN